MPRQTPASGPTWSLMILRALVDALLGVLLSLASLNVLLHT